MVNKSGSTRVNLYLPNTMLEKVDNLANELCLSRSACVTMLCSTYFTQQKAMDAMKDTLSEFYKLAETVK